MAVLGLFAVHKLVNFEVPISGLWRELLLADASAELLVSLDKVGRRTAALSG